MSSHDVKHIEHGAIVIANDLLAGHSVYRTAENGWSDQLDDALVLTDVVQAENCLDLASTETTAVIDPYLVATDLNGRPEHIREAIRVLGPTFQNSAGYSNSGYDFVGFG